eukprot:2786802-Prymnesium_polylepis.1
MCIRDRICTGRRCTARGSPSPPCSRAAAGPGPGCTLAAGLGIRVTTTNEMVRNALKRFET